MKRWLCLGMLFLSAGALAEKAETREMVGQIGSRGAYLVLHATERADGGWHMTGEYLILSTFTRRFLEGERSPQLGVATLKEGTSAILFGRPATGELRGTLRDGQFRGTRYGPGGQERERFEFTEEFPSMAKHSAHVRCEAGDGRYSAALGYDFDGGALKGPLEWQSSVGGAHGCAVRATTMEIASGALKARDGNCTVTLRELGDYVKVDASGCAAQCRGSQAYLEPMLVDRRGNCRLLRPEAR